jgi:hypothetical protein
MPRDILAVRIWPMSDKIAGFRGRGIKDVQADVFLRDLPRMKGRWRYPRVGLSAPPRAIVLFQYRAHVIASAVLLRDEKFPRPAGGYAGALYLDAASIRTFDPLDADAMRRVWPAFRRFGHVRQILNPSRYGMFRRRLKNTAAPTAPGRDA